MSEVFRQQRPASCPHCGAPGLFVHLVEEPDVLECDACGVRYRAEET